MKTILIVDDDYIARSKIRSLTDWEQHGYVIADEASNGREALEVLERSLPQIALIDMDMPVMNGVELIRKIKERGFPVAVIVLSSYNDFDYVRESMKLGAFDYILKNELNERQMLEAIARAGKGMDDLTGNRLTVKDREYIQELYVRRQLLGLWEEDEDFEGWIVKYQLPVDPVRNMLLLCEIDDYYLALEEMDEKSMLSLNQFIEKQFRETAHKSEGMTAVKMKDNKYCLVLSCKNLYSISEAQQFLNAALREIRGNLKRFVNLTVTASISSLCPGLAGLSGYYNLADNRLKNKFYIGKNGMIQEQESGGGDRELNFDHGHELMELLTTGGAEAACAKAGEVFAAFRDSRPGKKAVCRAVTELLNEMDRVARAKKLDFRMVCDAADPYQRVDRYETLDDLECWVLDCCRRLCGMMELKRENQKYNRLTVNAIDFISSNYRNPISLSDAATYLEVSSSHLSRVFKNDTGMNFVNYLNQLRISKAKKILEENDLVQMKNIAFETGFNSYNHFFSTFKNIVGMSPNEYLEKNSR